MHFPPSPGDRFKVLGRRELLTVGRVIACIRDEKHEEAYYVVETPESERWVLAQREMADGLQWIGQRPREKESP